MPPSHRWPRVPARWWVGGMGIALGTSARRAHERRARHRSRSGPLSTTAASVVVSAASARAPADVGSVLGGPGPALFTGPPTSACPAMSMCCFARRAIAARGNEITRKQQRGHPGPCRFLTTRMSMVLLRRGSDGCPPQPKCEHPKRGARMYVVVRSCPGQRVLELFHLYAQRHEQIKRASSSTGGRGFVSVFLRFNS